MVEFRQVRDEKRKNTLNVTVVEYRCGCENKYMINAFPTWNDKLLLSFPMLHAATLGLKFKSTTRLELRMCSLDMFFRSARGKNQRQDGRPHTKID